MITGRCDCPPCARGDETCSRTGPCEACKATMRLGDRVRAVRAYTLSALSLSAEQWDSLPRDEQLTLLAGLDPAALAVNAVSA